MIGLGYNSSTNFKKVSQAADDAKFRNLRRAAFAISKSAKESISTSDMPSPAGSAPNTRGKGRKNLRAAIYYDYDGETAIIGPRATYVGDSGEAHEFGKDRGDSDFDERRFMEPALQANLDGFARDWQGSIGE